MHWWRCLSWTLAHLCSYRGMLLFTSLYSVTSLKSRMVFFPCKILHFLTGKKPTKKETLTNLFVFILMSLKEEMCKHLYYCHNFWSSISFHQCIPTHWKVRYDRSDSESGHHTPLNWNEKKSIFFVCCRFELCLSSLRH